MQLRGRLRLPQRGACGAAAAGAALLWPMARHPPCPAPLLHSIARSIAEAKIVLFYLPLPFLAPRYCTCRAVIPACTASGSLVLQTLQYNDLPMLGAGQAALNMAGLPQVRRANKGQ